MTSTAPTPLRVLVYDDEANNAAGIVERLREFDGLDVDVLPEPERALQDLEERRRGARHGRDGGSPAGGNALDGVDVLVVDYDLTMALDADAGPAETGERVAYLVRSYSTCRTIVALNQFADTPTFDLTLLGHPASYADLNLDGTQIDNPGLWGRPHDGFLPWSWPDLSRAPAAHADRAAAAAESMRAPVLETLGLAETMLSNALSRRQLAWLTSGDTPVQSVTVESCAARSRLGLKPGDRAWSEEGLAGLAAARLHKWLDRVVIPGQDVLIDEPHLAARYASVVLDVTADGRPRLAEDTVGPHRHDKAVWTSRPVLRWPAISEDPRVPEVADPFAPVGETLRFAEDCSRLREHGETRPFTADVEPFSRRYVTRLPRDEQERSAAPYAGDHGLSVVSYQPAIHLAR